MSLVKLPPEARPGEPIRHEDFNALRSAVQMIALLPGVGYFLKRTVGGTALDIRAGKGGSTSIAPGPQGPFCKVFKDSGNWKLLGGTVSGGNGVATIPDITLGSIGNKPADGKHHWLAINYTTNEEDGVLLPNGDVGSVTVSSGASLPDNKVPTGASPSGKVHFSLGSWSQKEICAVRLWQCFRFLMHG